MKTVFRILIFFIPFIPSLIFGYLEKDSAMSISAGIGIIILIFINIDKFKKFKGIGIEAELKEIITEGQETIKEMRSLALKLVDPILTIVAIYNKMQHLDVEYQFETRDNVIKALKELKTNKSEIDKAVKFFNDYFTLIHANVVYYRVIENPTLKKHSENTLKGLKPTIEDKPEKSWKLIEKLNSIQEELPPEIIEKLKDFEYFLENKKLRKPENWGK